MNGTDTFEIDVVELVDGLVRDCVAANLPPLPAVLADVVAGVLCQRQSRTEYAATFAQLLVLIRKRVELAAASSDVVN